jgi:3-oxoacyl-[acyl-carrier-protein] synthase-3
MVVTPFHNGKIRNFGKNMKIKLNNVFVEAITTVVGSREVDLKSQFNFYGESELDKIIGVTGIEKVRYSDKEIASDLCFSAAERLFEELNIDRDQIDGILFVSQTRDYIIPSTAPLLQYRLGLKQDTVAMDIPYGCTGYIYGLYVASLMISTGSCKKVLLLAGDVNSKTINPLDRSLAMVFGDAGSATILSSNTDHSLYFNIMTDGSGYNKLIIPAGGFRQPSSDQTSLVTTRESGNARSDNDLFMDGMSVFNFAITKVPKILNETLADCAIDKSDLFAFHQANEIILKYIIKATKIPPSVAPFHAKNYGNTGPASIPLLFSSNFFDEKSIPLKKVVACGFGVGLSWGTSVLDLSSTKILETSVYQTI